MKKCLSCGLENADENELCPKCGAVLMDDDQITLELGDGEFEFSVKDHKAETPIDDAEFEFSLEDHEAETLIGDEGSQLTVELPAKKKSGVGRILVLVGIAAGLLLVSVGVVGLLGYLYLNSETQVGDLPAPPANTANSSAEPPVLPEIIPGIASNEMTEAPKETAETTPEVSFTPPVDPTRQGAFSISAARGWQLSDINTVSKEIFRTSAQGLIYLDGIKSNVSPEGVAGYEERRVYKEFPTGALLVRTRYADGKVSNIAHVTAADDWENYPNESGKLEFMVNDNAPEKNKGEFIVTVKVLNVPEEGKK